MDFSASWYPGANSGGPGNISSADFTGLEKVPKLKKLQLNRNWNLDFIEFPGVCGEPRAFQKELVIEGFWYLKSIHSSHDDVLPNPGSPSIFYYLTGKSSA